MRSLIKLAIVLAIVISAYVGFEYHRFKSTPITISCESIDFTVESGQNLLQISNKLFEEGISEFPPYYLYLYGRLLNQAHLVKAGQYAIAQTSTLPELLQQFIEGKVKQHSFTIVEGMTSQVLINNVISDDRFKRTIEDSQLASVMSALGKAEHHGEGEFAPETYYFQKDTTDIEFLNRAHNSMTETLNQLWAKKAQNLPYKSPYDALIMASII
jgi:UPF0755 protein